ncbi:MAG: glycosyltransferase family 2 protein [Candidatus Nealsonbacteria bacterium]
MKLSIIIPVYNEESTIEKLISQIEEINIEKELIIVDDGSFDQTSEILKFLKKKHNFILLTHAENQGKGAAIQTALKHIRGELVIIQDADLETKPDNYPKLIEPIVDGKAKVVYGVRIRSFKNLNLILKVYFLGGKFLTWLANLLFGSNLADINTPCKLFRTEILKNLNLQSKGFDIDFEITAKILKQNYSLIEIPIPYFPRTFKEGKKIRMKDGLKGALALIRYRFGD